MLPAKLALRSGFSDYANIVRPDSLHVCAACSWVMGGIPPHTLRMWCVIYGCDAGPSDPKAPPVSGFTLVNRSGTVRIIEAIRNHPKTPWFVSIAQSGQKHILPFTQANSGAEEEFTIRFESTNVRTTVEAFNETLALLTKLRAHGFSAEEITSGRLMSLHINVESVELWRACQERLFPIKSSPLVAMCLWLLTKEAIQYEQSLSA